MIICLAVYAVLVLGYTALVGPKFVGRLGWHLLTSWRWWVVIVPIGVVLPRHSCLALVVGGVLGATLFCLWDRIPTDAELSR